MKEILMGMSCLGTLLLFAGLFFLVIPAILTHKIRVEPITLVLIGIGGLFITIPLTFK